MKASVCGVYCDSECQAFGKECQGCITIKGKVSWAKFIDKDICPIYECVNRKGFYSCNECLDLPCHIWLVETKNPNMTSEEYKQDLEKRMKNLKNKINRS